MSSATSIAVQSSIAQKISYVSQIITLELEILDDIEQLCHSLWSVQPGMTTSTLASSLHETRRRLADEFHLAQQNLQDKSVDELWGELIHFTAVPSQQLFDLIFSIDQEFALDYSEKQKIRHLISEHFRLLSLNQAIYLVEQAIVHQPITAVSLLHCLQKPNTLNKSVCIQISGSGARQAIIGYEKVIQTSFDFIFWALSGTVPQNQVWVDSDMSQTAVYLQIWNDALTLIPERLEEFAEISQQPSLFQLNRFEGVIPALVIAQKLIRKVKGELNILPNTPTKIEIVFPLKNQ